ncbi:MAG: carbohydrate kinase [Gammaproteobacteria bacterium]|jgi:fructokinase
MNETDILVFGEVLFDRFEDQTAVLGGAPFNVAWHLEGFGHSPRFISRIGNDALGHRVLEAMRVWGMRTNELQTDPALPTGTVDVTLEHGEPSYEIVHPAAWDAIAAPDEVPASGLLYHGTLALRDARSRSALARIRAGHSGGVFVDVNLRDPWWHADQVTASLHHATWVKLNEAELEALRPSATPQDFLQEFALQGLVVTHGARGAEILTVNGQYAQAQPRANVDVVDAVGAGDAFSAVIITGLTRGWPLTLCAERAQSFASAILGHRGATVSKREFYEAVLSEWDETQGD